MDTEEALRFAFVSGDTLFMRLRLRWFHDIGKFRGARQWGDIQRLKLSRFQITKGKTNRSRSLGLGSPAVEAVIGEVLVVIHALVVFEQRLVFRGDLRDSCDHLLKFPDRCCLLGIEKNCRLFPPDHQKYVHLDLRSFEGFLLGFGDNRVARKRPCALPFLGRRDSCSSGSNVRNLPVNLVFLRK